MSAMRGQSLVLATSTGLAVSTFLELTALRQLEASCPLTNHCAQVLHSPITEALPVRLSAVGMVAFGLLLTWLLGPPTWHSPRAANLWIWGARASLCVSICLTLYSVLAVHALCTWCSCVLLCLIAISALTARGAQFLAAQVSSLPGYGQTLALVPVLVGVWGGFSAHRTDTLVLDAPAFASFAKFPQVGRGNAAKALVVDFGCPHCQALLRKTAAQGAAFLVAPVTSDKPGSGVMLNLFASAYRQGLATRFCTQLPEDGHLQGWIPAIRDEIGTTQKDTATARAWSAETSALVKRYGLEAVPVTVTQTALLR